MALSDRTLHACARLSSGRDRPTLVAARTEAFWLPRGYSGVQHLAKRPDRVGAGVALRSVRLGCSHRQSVEQQETGLSEEFEVRGAHEDRMDEAAEREPKGMAGQLAVMTAILATVGAMFSYMAGATQANAGLFKNDAATKKTEASNQ